MGVADRIACSLLWLCACKSASVAPEAPGASERAPSTDGSKPTPELADPDDAKAASAAGRTSPTDAATPPKGAQPRDPIAAAACNIDSDCGWDDPCKPARCGLPGANATCKDSAPAPGECLCVEQQCTMKPKIAPAPAGPCELRACVVDRPAGKCIDDDGGVPENLRTTAGVVSGPSCDCTNPAEGCAWSWFEPVACKSDRECWIDPAPRTHPIARPKKLRGRDFKPCKDGEVAPKCGPEGTCTIGPAYTC
jgi:hypothetical protein